MGYGGGSYCANCALGNSGLTSRGFGFGGGSYGSSSTNVASQPWSTVYSNTRGISPTVYAGGYGAGYGGTSGYGTAIPTASSSSWTGTNSNYGAIGTQGAAYGYGSSLSPSYGSFPYTTFSSLPTSYASYNSLPQQTSLNTNYGTYSSLPVGYGTNYGSNYGAAYGSSYSSYPSLYGNYNNAAATNILSSLLTSSGYQKKAKA